MRTLLLQLADSAFPTGAFAHSLGLEALHKLGQLRDEAELIVRLRELAWSTALGALPFVAHAHARDADVADRSCHAFLSSHVASRASRAQGAALRLTARAAFGVELALPHAHIAPMTGALLARLDTSIDEAQRVFLFGTLRSALSAAVRLGVVGPLRAQALLFGCGEVIEDALRAAHGQWADDAAATSPLFDLYQGAHDRLYTRLFQS